MFSYGSETTARMKFWQSQLGLIFRFVESRGHCTVRTDLALSSALTSCRRVLKRPKAQMCC